MNKHLISSEVDRELDQVARLAAWEAARILGLAMPRVQWVKCDIYERRAGWVNEDIKNTIFLSADWAKDNGDEQTRALIFHEARHLWQIKTMRYYGYGEGARKEADANAFAYRRTGVHLNLKMWFEHDY